MLRTLPRSIPQFGRFSARSLSTRSFNDLSLDIDTESKVAVLTMQKKPVNSLSLETLSEMRAALEELDADKNCHGLVLTSSVPRIFCAGLDILEMYNPKEDRLKEFWSTLQDVWLKLYGSRLATIAAINGNSPAGGCLLAMSCDYRIMAEGNYSIGLNETKLGIVAPFWFQDTMENTIGHRQTEMALMLGRMYSTSDALDIGLVDKLVPESEVLNAAKQELVQWLQIPGMARAYTKQQLRRKALESLSRNKKADTQRFVDFCLNPSVQKSLEINCKVMHANTANHDAVATDPRSRTSNGHKLSETPKPFGRDRIYLNKLLGTDSINSSREPPEGGKTVSASVAKLVLPVYHHIPTQNRVPQILKLQCISYPVLSKLCHPQRHGASPYTFGYKRFSSKRINKLNGMIDNLTQHSARERNADDHCHDDRSVRTNTYRKTIASHNKCHNRNKQIGNPTAQEIVNSLRDLTTNGKKRTKDTTRRKYIQSENRVGENSDHVFGWSETPSRSWKNTGNTDFGHSCDRSSTAENRGWRRSEHENASSTQPWNNRDHTVDRSSTAENRGWRRSEHENAFSTQPWNNRDHTLDTQALQDKLNSTDRSLERSATENRRKGRNDNRDSTSIHDTTEQDVNRRIGKSRFGNISSSAEKELILELLEPLQETPENTPSGKSFETQPANRTADKRHTTHDNSDVFQSLLELKHGNPKKDTDKLRPDISGINNSFEKLEVRKDVEPSQQDFHVPGINNSFQEPKKAENTTRNMGITDVSGFNNDPELEKLYKELKIGDYFEHDDKDFTLETNFKQSEVTPTPALNNISQNGHKKTRGKAQKATGNMHITGESSIRTSLMHLKHRSKRTKSTNKLDKRQRIVQETLCYWSTDYDQSGDDMQ